MKVLTRVVVIILKCILNPLKYIVKTNVYVIFVSNIFPVSCVYLFAFQYQKLSYC